MGLPKDGEEDGRGHAREAGRCVERDQRAWTGTRLQGHCGQSPVPRLTGVGGAQDDVWFPQQPGRQATLEKHAQQRGRQRNRSAARAGTQPKSGQRDANAQHQSGMCPAGRQPGHRWRGSTVGMPARKANPAVPFPDHPSPLCASLGGWGSPSPTPHRCRAPAAGSPEAPARLSGPGRLPRPGPQQSHKPPAAARGSSRGRSWGERGDQHPGMTGDHPTGWSLCSWELVSSLGWG